MNISENSEQDMLLYALKVMSKIFKVTEQNDKQAHKRLVIKPQGKITSLVSK